MRDKCAEFRDRCARARQGLLGAANIPEATQGDLLNAFIRRNVGTAFGKEHGFEHLRTVDDFRRAVPIRDHAGFAPWLDCVSRGEAGVLTTEPPAMFFRTAGTTGAPKTLPVTKTAMGTTRGPAMYALWGNFLEFHPELLENEHSTIDIHWDRRPVTKTVGSHAIAVQSMAQRHGLLHPDDFSPPWYEAPWFRPQIEIADYVERMYSKIRFFAQKDVRAVVSINPVTLHLFAETLARNTDRLIDELRSGAGLAGSVADSSLARRLRSAVDARGGRLLPADLWPRVSFLGCRKSATAALYIPKLYKLFGEQVEVLPYSTAGAEGSQAIPVDRHDTAGIAALSSAFMEFLPATAAWRADSPTSLVHELELHAEYQTVLTTPDGLYRYAIGDIFKVVGFFGRVPQLEYRGRTGRFSSIVGERLSERQVVDAGQLVASRFGLDLAMFMCCPRQTPRPHYVFVMETSARVAERSAVAAALDDELSLANPDYREGRASGALAPVSVEFVDPGAFHDHWLRSMLGGRGTIQLQIQPLQKDDTIIRSLAERSC
jgi:hypothetical protein